jgi:hypothetical protein
MLNTAGSLNAQHRRLAQSQYTLLLKREKAVRGYRQMNTNRRVDRWDHVLPGSKWKHLPAIMIGLAHDLRPGIRNA